MYTETHAPDLEVATVSEGMQADRAVLVNLVNILLLEGKYLYTELRACT